MAFDHGSVWVVALEGDPHVNAALPVFEGLHTAPEQLVQASTIERLIAVAEGEPALSEWATQFAERYLDVSVVMEGG